ncbi:MAG: threonine/serine exporter family protein, partial [Anaerovoracaceae bacterium]
SYEPIIIGSIMLFVPGVAITNSIRDFLSGDMLSGIARMTEAVLTAVSLAAGAGVMLKLWGVIGGVIV